MELLIFSDFPSCASSFIDLNSNMELLILVLQIRPFPELSSLNSNMELLILEHSKVLNACRISLNSNMELLILTNPTSLNTTNITFKFQYGATNIAFHTSSV